MADASRRIKVDELNFDDIKNNIKTFLKGQKQFKDYNFDGSGLSVILDILAYNTHYNALYNNMAVNEMFLDSASKRDSVVSIAKMLGYTPRSARCATATINVVVSGITTENNQLLLPARSIFTSGIDNVTYNFINLEDQIAEFNSTTNSFIFSNIQIKEGKYQSQKYIVEPGVKFTISNPNCDTSTLKVYINDSTGVGNAISYSLAEDVLTLDGTSEVYFLKEMENGIYEIYFGDGRLGKKVQNGNVVTITYMTTSGDAANTCKYFTANLGTAFGKVSVRTVTPALGGDLPEDIDSIRFNAPRAYSNQNRAVTEEDYKNLVYRYLPEAQTVNVWGGEENDPPVYGKVYLSIKPTTGDYLDAPTKSFITNQILRPKSIVTAIPEIVDPDYINIALATTVYYNPKETNLGVASLQSKIVSTINNYNNTELIKFDGMFRYSKLGRLIDASDKSFQNSITTITIRREMVPAFDTASSYTVNLGNPIYNSGVPEDAVNTTGFYIPGSDLVYYIKDDGEGNLVMYYISGVDEIVVNRSIGYVNYTKGVLHIEELTIDSLASNKFEFIIKPQSYDVVSVRNQIVRIDPELMTVRVLVDPISSGSARGGNAYIFTPSR